MLAQLCARNARMNARALSPELHRGVPAGPADQLQRGVVEVSGADVLRSRPGGRRCQHNPVRKGFHTAQQHPSVAGSVVCGLVCLWVPGAALTRVDMYSLVISTCRSSAASSPPTSTSPLTWEIPYTGQNAATRSRSLLKRLMKWEGGEQNDGAGSGHAAHHKVAGGATVHDRGDVHQRGLVPVGRRHRDA